MFSETLKKYLKLEKHIAHLIVVTLLEMKRYVVKQGKKRNRGGIGVKKFA